MEPLVNQMKTCLATVFSMYLKAHNFHWNVTGPDFAQYHDFLKELYEALHNSTDNFAENIRYLDAFAPGSYSRFAELTKIADATTVPSGLVMLERLAQDNEIVIEELMKAHELATENKKFGLLNFIEDRLDYHGKLHWMLNAFRPATA